MRRRDGIGIFLFLPGCQEKFGYSEIARGWIPDQQRTASALLIRGVAADPGSKGFAPGR
jgi:hypothetical protein